MNRTWPSYLPAVSAEFVQLLDHSAMLDGVQEQVERLVVFLAEIERRYSAREQAVMAADGLATFRRQQGLERRVDFEAWLVENRLDLASCQKRMGFERAMFLLKEAVVGEFAQAMAADDPANDIVEVRGTISAIGAAAARAYTFGPALRRDMPDWLAPAVLKISEGMPLPETVLPGGREMLHGHLFRLTYADPVRYAADEAYWPAILQHWLTQQLAALRQAPALKSAA